MILVISYPEDEHTVDVIQRLQQKGREVLLTDLSSFPAHKGLAMSWQTDIDSAYLIDGTHGMVDLQNTKVCWWRRVRPYVIDTAIMNPSMRAFAESETSQAVSGMLNALSCSWVNPRSTDDAAQHKPYQWAIAQKVGLQLPRTLVTTKPEVARSFINDVGIGKTVFKAFLASVEAWRETRLVVQDDYERLDLVRFAPVIFQEYVEGVDLRITVIGDTVFAAEIDAQKTSYPVDMRMVVGEATVRPINLPPGLHTAILELQRRLGLKYGAIDMRRTPNGDYIFFEVNPAGQWLFVERRTGMPISQAIANLLAALDEGSC